MLYCDRLKKVYRFWMKTFSESHIKYWTLGLKDAEHNKEFVER
jgi:hypothetical protein